MSRLLPDLFYDGPFVGLHLGYRPLNDLVEAHCPFSTFLIRVSLGAPLTLAYQPIRARLCPFLHQAKHAVHRLMTSPHARVLLFQLKEEELVEGISRGGVSLGPRGFHGSRASLLYAGLEELVKLELVTQSLIDKLLLFLDVICQGVQLREKVMCGDTRIVGTCQITVHHPLFN